MNSKTRRNSGPYGVFDDKVSRVSASKTPLPEELPVDQIDALGNLVKIDESFIKNVEQLTEKKAKVFRNKLAQNMFSTILGLDQAIDWTLVMMKDAFKIEEGSINNGIKRLVDHAANISLMEKVLDMLNVSPELKTKFLDELVVKGMEHTFKLIERDKGHDRTPRKGLSTLVVDRQLRDKVQRELEAFRVKQKARFK